MRVTLPFGHGEKEFELKDANLLGIVSPTDVKASPEPERVIEMSLENPVGTEPLSSLAGKGKKVAIAVDDLTRTTPTHLVLLPLLKRLEQGGVRREDIEIIIALGTHRDMTESEMKEKYGTEVVEDYNVVNHSHDDEKELKNMGTVADNVPVWINKDFIEADLRIATGNVIPHFNAGWGAGAKILLPGLAGRETVGRMHFYSAMTTPNGLGMHDNPTRRLIEVFAEKVGLHLLVNTVITRQREIVSAYSGHFKKAHRLGVKEASNVYGVKIRELSDITVSSSYPADIEFWQGEKGLFSADLATREGGGIVLVTPCPEGLAVTHRAWADYLQRDPRDIIDDVEGGRADDLVAAGIALNVTKVRERRDIYVVSDGITSRDAEKIKFKKYDTVEEALDQLYRKQGSDSRVSVLTHGGETYPILE